MPRRFDLPVRLATRVTSVTRDGDGFVVTTGESRIECDDVVLAHRHLRPHAAGAGLRRPARPVDPAAALERVPAPSQLADGTVLVVGASHSGCDIAYEVAATHPTIIVGPDTGQIPVRVHVAPAKVVFPAMLFALHATC